ncbi:MAG: tetratricopeptide repeat protein [Acidobacteriia bacterium]|nr:tetratricopeptide repeat protein [Terriglobia bacterium]
MLRRSITLFLVFFLFGFTAIYFLQRRINGVVGEYHQTEEMLFLPSGSVVKKLSLGFESLVADIYWIRAIQYFAGGRMRDPSRKFDLLYPMLDITTTLDPAIIPVYEFGAVFLSEPPPIGANDPQRAIGLLEKGIAANPDDPELYLRLGFVYYWYLKDYKQAAGIFLRGSKLPQAKPWLRTMAAFSLSKGGERASSKFLWRQIYESSENKRAKENALAHLAEMQAEDQIEALEKVTAKFREDSGRWPRSFIELATHRYLRGIPLDPSGVPYLLDPESGKVMVSADTKLQIVPK